LRQLPRRHQADHRRSAFFFHTTKLADQFDVAFGRAMSRQWPERAADAARIQRRSLLFVIGPLRWPSAGAPARAAGWLVISALAPASC
jgi:hypothetical protein